MQQQAALMAATQGSYLNPMAAIAAAQMQQMAAFNVNGLVATPMTPSSGILTIQKCKLVQELRQIQSHKHTHTCARAIPDCCPRTFVSLVRVIEAAIMNLFEASLLLPLLQFLRGRVHFQKADIASVKLAWAELYIEWDMTEENVQHSLTLIGSHIIAPLSPPLSLIISSSVCHSFPPLLRDSVCFLGRQPIRWLWMQSPWLIQYKSKDLCEIIQDPSLTYLFWPLSWGALMAWH